MKKTIEDIIAREWEMFQRVNEGGPRAYCQDDYPTFYGMRYGQFCEWSERALILYLDDLRAAKASGRNLVGEKYIWMMMEGSPEDFTRLSPHVLFPTARAKELADSICAIMLKQTERLHERYPAVAGSGRALYASDGDGYASVETYQYSELLTYSENTLEALLGHINELASSGVSFAERILTNSVKHYGYGDLHDAENAVGGE